MSILIKDMEMPIDGCHHIICIYADGTVATGGREYRAVPVSEPHGRLIDADALIIGKSQEFIHKSMVFGGQYVFSESEILNAPTIIEADYPPSSPLEQVCTELFGEGESDVRRTD